MKQTIIKCANCNKEHQRDYSLQLQQIVPCSTTMIKKFVRASDTTYKMVYLCDNNRCWREYQLKQKLDNMVI